MSPSSPTTKFPATCWDHVACFMAICLLTLLAAGRTRAAESAASAPVPAVPRPGSNAYEEGGYVYERNCLICHGPMGDGHGEMAPSLTIKPRSFRSGLFKYRSTPWGKLPTKADLEHTVRGGITGTAMGMFSQLTDSEISSVVEYIKIFSRKWRKPENYAPAVPLPPQPVWLADDAGREQHASKGSQTFQLVCATCHGTEGDGKGPAAAALKDDLGGPAVPADLRQPHLRSGDDASDLFRVLMTGLNGTPMVSFAEAFNEEQKWDLVAYLITLRRDFATSGK